MGIMTRHWRAARIAAAATVALGAALFIVSIDTHAGTQAPAPQAGSGEQPATPAQAQQKAAEAAKHAYEAGVKSYQVGKHQAAIDTLSTALRGGGLTSGDMSKALYYRGLAYKKLAKPGLAISDLTSALWLKNGLNDIDRKSALAERAEAYKTAGLGDGNTGADEVSVADPNAAAAPVAAAAKTTAATKATSKQVAAQPVAAPAVPAPVVPAPLPQTATATPAAAAKTVDARAADTGVPQPLSLGGETATAPPQTIAASGAAGTAAGVDQLAAMDQPRQIGEAAKAPGSSAAAAPEAQPSSGPQSSGSQSSGQSGIGGFFSNLFSSSKPAPPANLATAATGAPPTTSGLELEQRDRRPRRRKDGG